VIAFLWSLITYLDYIRKVEFQKSLPKMDIAIPNYGDNWEAATGSSGKIAKTGFAKIRSISFGTEGKDLYVRFKLQEKLPATSDEANLFITRDRLKCVTFYLYLFAHYYDNSGKKNPENPDAELKISFYGNEPSLSDSKKISVEGELIEGGPGYNYFLVKYPYRQILLSQNSNRIVFSAYSLVLTNNFPAGIGIFNFQNPLLAIEKDLPTRVGVDLHLAD
jgi:hypothetical protein